MNKKILATLGLTVGIAFLGACGENNDDINTDNSVPDVTAFDSSTTIMTGATGG